MRINKVIREESIAFNLPSLVLLDNGSTAELVGVPEIPNDLDYRDFSLKVLIEGGASELLKPTPMLGRSPIEENNAFQSVVSSASELLSKEVKTE